MKIHKLSVAIAVALTCSSPLMAQETQNEEKDYEQIIVTGTSVARAEADTPAKTTLIDEEAIAKRGFSSQANILLTVPGIKVEGGGGEVATNAFVRGLPSGGQFQFTPLNYDGMPAFQSGMTSSAQDVYYRPDIGIERVEFVGGGASNLFGPGSVAGIINYISKTGSDDAESTVQLEVAEEGRVRTDFFTSGPLSSDDQLYYAFSGYYRHDEGPLDTGLPTKGYQLRGNIKKEFDDGHITVYGQLIDDQVQFFLPLPLDGGSRERLTGNNGDTVFVAQSVAAADIRYQTPRGEYESPIRDGVSTDGGSLAVEFLKELNDQWTISGKLKGADYDHQFNLFLDGDGIANSPEPLDGYVSNPARGIDGQTLVELYGTPSYTFTETGQAVPDNYLLFGNRLLDRQRNGSFFSSEFNVTGTFDDVGGFDHTVNIGTFVMRASQQDFNIISSYLADFSDGGSARLVDLSFTDTDGNVVQYSRNGITGPGVSYTNRDLESNRTAFYITDQLENDRWAIDLGMRVERADGSIKSEGNEWVIVDNDAGLAPNLQRNRTGNGRFTYGEVATTEVAFSGALLYKMDEHDLNLYANASSGYFFPQIRSVRFNANGEPQSYEGEDVRLAAIGLKYFPKDLYIDASLFTAQLKNRRSVDFVNNGSGDIVEEVILQSTETFGAEVIGRWRVSDVFTIDGNITYQDAEFTENGNAAAVGRTPRRQPDLTGNLAVTYDDGFWDARVGVSYFGDAYANDTNTVELDSHNITTLDAGYTWEFANSQSLRVGVGVWNLFDSDGVTEGSPRQGNAQVAGGEFFVGRPILPRRISITARYDF